MLGAPTYGVVGVAAAALLYLTRITDLGLELGLGVREIAADPGFVTRGVPPVLAARLLLAGVLALGSVVVGVTLLPQPDGAALAIYGLTLLATATSTRWVLLGAERSRAAALAMTFGQLAMALLVLAMVRGPGDVAWVPAAQVGGDLLAAVLCALALPAAVRALPVRLEFATLRPLLPRAWSLVASALLGIVIYNANFLFLRALSGPAAVGWYAAAYTLVTFFLNIGQAYNLSLLPALTRLRTDGESQLDLYHTALAQVSAVGLPLALGGSLVAPALVGLLYGPGYAEAALPYALLIWSVPLNLLRDVPLMALLSAGEERMVFRITLAAALLSLALNALLIPMFGLVGAATATVLTEAVRGGLAIWAARRHGLPFPGPGRFWRTLGASAAMAGVLVLGMGRVPTLVLVPTGALAYAAALWAVGGIRVARGRLPALSV